MHIIFSNFKKIKENLSNNEQILYARLFGKDGIKYTAGGIGNNKKLMGMPLRELYNKYIQKQDNLKEILKNVFTEFIISLRDYNKEMQDFVKYVSTLDILVTKAYISKKYNYCKINLAISFIRFSHVLC